MASLGGVSLTTMSPLDLDRIENILVRSTNWLGDAVMTTPALDALRSRCPRARITVLANKLTAPLFSPHPSVDEVITFDRAGRHKGVSGRLRLAAELRKHSFDLAVLLPNSFDSALVAFLAGIPKRLGYRSDGRGLLLTHGVPVTGRTKRLHHVDCYRELLASCGIPPVSGGLSLHLAENEQERAAHLLAEAGIGANDFLLGINPGAAYGSAKRWYPDRFAVVARELSSRWGAKVLITGGPAEAEIAADIAASLGGDCLNTAGKTDLRLLMALIGRCNFFVTNDSGPMHVAAALGTPLVAIFGPTDSTTTSPYSPHARVVRVAADCAPCLKRECPTDHRCMTGVTPEQVIDAAVSLRESIEGT